MKNSSQTIGATPDGSVDTTSASRAVREMFGSIAPRYDLLNHVLSLNIDRLWWRRTARAFQNKLSLENARVLDLCCGTGDMTLALRKAAGDSAARILGADFSHPMLQRANEKFKSTRMQWVEADALQLPFPDGSFDLVVSAFGFRNLADYNAGLREICRVLRPGGEVGILDFSEPGGAIGVVYRIYFKHILPKIGGWISGIKGPYSYLPASVEKFPEPNEMLNRMRHCGFKENQWKRYTFGIAGLYRGKK